MPDLDHEIRLGLERLSDPTPASVPLTFDRLARRRRQRRNRHAVLTIVPVVVLLGLLAGRMPSGSDEGTTVVADGGPDGAPSSATSGTVSMTRREVGFGGDAIARVVMEFDGPLPGRDARYIDRIWSIEPGNEILFTTQRPPKSVQLCRDAHSIPPTAKGSVDLLIPVHWFSEDEDTHANPRDNHTSPPLGAGGAKFPVCGPYRGFFQYSIWAPASVDPADVDVTVDPDGRRITMQIGPPPETTSEGIGGVAPGPPP